MSRIERKFSDLKAGGKKAFIPFITAGEPSKELSLKIALELVRLGADLLELGVPFSDPIADGPTIQASSARALMNGTSLTDVLAIAQQVRLSSDIPIVLFSYFNPILHYGVENLASEAAKAGVDGVLVTDIVDDEARSLSRMLALRGIDLISLIAPTTTNGRLEKIASEAKGFIYAVARTGVTGAGTETGAEAQTLVKRARKFTDLPIVVGFGVSTRAQVAHVWEYADGAVVGSAIVREIERSIGTGNTVETVGKFVRKLKPAVAKDAVEI
jgi:tryptophan synthase alpha chain